MNHLSPTVFTFRSFENRRSTSSQCFTSWNLKWDIMHNEYFYFLYLKYLLMPTFLYLFGTCTVYSRLLESEWGALERELLEQADGSKSLCLSRGLIWWHQPKNVFPTCLHSWITDHVFTWMCSTFKVEPSAQVHVPGLHSQRGKYCKPLTRKDNKTKLLFLFLEKLKYCSVSWVKTKTLVLRFKYYIFQ